MANWRAQVRLPAGLDQKIKEHAVAQRMKLKDAVQAMIDDGIEEMRANGAGHSFIHANLTSAPDVGNFEYVIDERYRAEVDSVTAFITGQGKRGKALTETIGLGARRRGL